MLKLYVIMKRNRASHLLFWMIMAIAATCLHFYFFHQSNPYCINSTEAFEFEFYFEEGLKNVPHCGWGYPQGQIYSVPHCKQAPFIEAAQPFHHIQVPLFEEIEIP